MEKDARHLSSDQQKLLRIKAVDMYFVHKISQRQIGKLLKVSRQHVCKWTRAFELGGYEALELGRRGRKVGVNQKLQPRQCATIVKIIKDKTPDQLKMPFVLWERITVRQLIKDRFGVILSLSSVSNYLKRWNMTAQKPIKRAYEQDSKKINEWLKKEYPEIQKHAKQEGAEIFWADETGVQNNDNIGRSFSPKGKTPVIKNPGKRIRMNMISAITNKGHVRFMIYSDKMNQQQLIKFLKRLIKSTENKVFVILDNLKVHHGKIVKKWAQENEDQIRLFYIPSYAPELNPDEYLNRDLKKNVNAKRFPKNDNELKSNLTSFMKKLQKRPSRVCNYFNASNIQYAQA